VLQCVAVCCSVLQYVEVQSRFSSELTFETLKQEHLSKFSLAASPKAVAVEGLRSDSTGSFASMCFLLHVCVPCI